MQWNQPLVEPEPPRFTGIDLCTRSDLCPWLHVSHPLGLVTSGRGSMSTASHPKIRFSQPASQTLCRSPAPLCAHSLVESAWFCGPTSESLYCLCPNPPVGAQLADLQNLLEEVIQAQSFVPLTLGRWMPPPSAWPMPTEP